MHIVNYCPKRKKMWNRTFFLAIVWRRQTIIYVCFKNGNGEEKNCVWNYGPLLVHDSLAAESLECLSSFKRDLNSLFAKRQNEWCSQSGPLFENPYGSAVKIGAKNARTNLIYVGNNPVERQLVKRAELYRWNYIAYAVSDHPFSDRLVKRNVSWALRNSLREVEIQRERCLPLTYPLLGRISRKLDINEKRQLTDFIVKTYNVIDYDAALSFFDGSSKAN